MWDSIPDMGNEDDAAVDVRLGARLAELRAERGWTLGELAERSGISRSTLSRAERAEISPTASLLNRLCHVYGRTMSHLLSEVERESALLVRAADQTVWTDQASDSSGARCRHRTRDCAANWSRDGSPCGADIAYDRPPVPGLEQHIWVLDGRLDVTAQDTEHRLGAGDCLRLRVWGPTRFRCPGPEDARYALAVVLP